MRTPSLRRRVILSGVAVFTLLVLVLDAFVYLSLRARLEDTLADVLAARVELARELDVLVDANQLATRLQAVGVPAVVTTADGDVISAAPAVPRFQQGPPGDLVEIPHPRVSATVALTDGGTAEVFATRAGVDGTLRRVLILMAVGTALAVIAAIVLFRRAAAVAIAPLDQVVDAAHRTAAGHVGERLHADDPATELGRMAVAYDQMLDALEDALAQTRDADERTRRFLDDAAHQLRTPIAGVRSSVESLLRTTDPIDHDRLLANLVREAARAARVLNGLLVLARGDQDSIHDLVPVDLVALCGDEVERAQSLAPRLTVAFRHHRPRVVARLDELGVRDVVANLLDNARRHASTRIEVTVELQGDHVEVRVADDGGGVAPEDRERIFERFVSADGFGGSGLGLAIGRAIAEAHAGSLVYDGAFVLSLPLDPPSPAPVTNPADAAI